MANEFGGPFKAQEKVEVQNPVGNAASLVLYDKNGIPFHIFVDNSGVLRTSTNPPVDGNLVP